MAKPVRVYTTVSCPYCIGLKEYLSRHGVAFENRDVGADPAAREEMVAKSGQLGVPVVEIGEKIIVGFDRPAIAAELDIHEDV